MKNKSLVLATFAGAFTLASCNSGSSSTTSSTTTLNLTGYVCAVNGSPSSSTNPYYPLSYESTTISVESDPALAYVNGGTPSNPGAAYNGLYNAFATSGYYQNLTFTNESAFIYLVTNDSDNSEPPGALAAGFAFQSSTATGNACLSGIYFQGLESAAVPDIAAATVTNCLTTESMGAAYANSESFTFSGVYNITANESANINAESGNISFTCVAGSVFYGSVTQN